MLASHRSFSSGWPVAYTHLPEEIYLQVFDEVFSPKLGPVVFVSLSFKLHSIE